MSSLKIQGKTILYLLIVSTSLFGFFSLIGIPTFITKGLYVIVPIFLSVILIFNRSGIYYAPFLNYFISYSVLIFISAVLNNGINIEVISFYHYTLISYLVLLFGVNMNLDNSIKQINRIFLYLIGLQIIVTFLKLLIVGRQEAIVGTMSLTNGSLNTIYPFLAVAFLASLYLFVKPKKIYLFLILLLFAVPYVGEKRAFIFFFPIVVFFMTFLVYKIKKIKFPVKSLFIVSFWSLVIFILGAMTNQTLNLSNSLQGSQFGLIDISKLINYVVSYNYGKDIDGLAVGRFSGLMQSIKYISSQDVSLFLFGNGPDSLINYVSRDGTEAKFGIWNSGSINGLATYLISVGFLGTASYLAFFLAILNSLLGQIELPNISKGYIYFGITSIVVFFIDFAIYSRSLAHSHVFAVWLFLYAGYALRVNKKIKPLNIIN